MQKELKKPTTEDQKIDPSAIKQQFEQMHQQQQGPTTEQIAEQEKQRKEQEEHLDKVLPYLRKMKEATELEISLMEMDVMLGRINPVNIPGPIGKKMEILVAEHQMNWSHMKLEQQALVKRAMEEKKELEELAKKEKESETKA